MRRSRADLSLPSISLESFLRILLFFGYPTVAGRLDHPPLSYPLLRPHHDHIMPGILAATNKKATGVNFVNRPTLRTLLQLVPLTAHCWPPCISCCLSVAGQQQAHTWLPSCFAGGGQAAPLHAS